VDEGHSDWEKSDLPSGEDTYGDETGYNFSACFRWMRHEFGPVRRLYESVTPDLLRGTDVLVLKTPTRPFDADERRAVEEFVASGGGLVLVGDHTNVFGTGEVLNAVAEPFGVRFRYDVVFDHRARFEHVWSPEWPEDVHPIAQSIGAVRFEVGCSLECSRIDARDVVVGRGMKTLPIDYAASNFYPQIRDDSQMRHGAVTEVLALTHGAGRVVAVADSTLFSTFSVCHAGRRELLENAVRWAGREDVGEPLRWLLWGAGVALLVVLVPAAARRGPGAAGLALCLTMGAASLVNAVAAALGDGGEAANPDQPPPAEILFMSESNDRVVWPVRTLVRDPGKSFDMFFQWVNRVDEFPRLVRMAELRPREAQTVFVIEPRELTDDDAETLVGIARAGGCVVLVETEPNAGVARVAAAAEMRLDTGAVDGAATVESAFGAVFDGVPSAPWRAVAGGRPILVSRSKEGRGVQTVGAMNAVGRGWIGVFTCGALFTDAQYGYRYNVMPTGILRRRYAVQFALLRACGRAPDARTGG
jgi:hypothetical protein